MKKVTLLTIVAIIILGIYVLPGVTARFAGSHTWELNKSMNQNERVAGLNCGKCHVYIKDEWATGLSANIATRHKNASNSSNYMSSSSNIIKVATAQGTDDDVCLMCHAVEFGIGYAGHTRVTIRACTDGDCHGTHPTGSINTNKTGQFGQTLNITAKLNNSADGHMNFYRPLSEKASTYTMEDNTDSTDTTDSTTYSAGFYACIGCHTHVGVQMQLQRPDIYNFTLTYNGATSTWNVPLAPNANTTSINIDNSYYQGTGSKWK